MAAPQIGSGLPLIAPAATKYLGRGGRVVECTALEMRHTREGIEGSNPSLSARNASFIQ
jgi:hypothetical protein